MHSVLNSKSDRTPKMKSQQSKPDMGDMGASFKLYDGKSNRSDRSESRSRSTPGFGNAASNSRAAKKKAKMRKKKYQHMVQHSIDLHMDNTSNAGVLYILDSYSQRKVLMFLIDK